MNQSERLDLFIRDLTAVLRTPDGILIFNVKGDDETFVQFSQRAGELLYCEVSSHAWGGKKPPLNAAQCTQLAALGYEIPSPLTEANPGKSYNGTREDLADEVEKIFREVFGLAETYDVVSSGVFV